MLAGPKRVGNGREVVDKRNGVAVLGQVDRAEIKLAGVAGLDAHVWRFFGDINRQFAFGFFAAGWAQDAAKFPFLRAERAEQESLAAISLGAQHPDQRT